MNAAPVPVGWDGGAAAVPGLAGTGVIGLRGQPDRDSARLAIRAALRAALAAHCGVDGGQVQLHSPPGAAPWAVVDIGAAPRRVPLAISHDGALSVAAFSFTDAVGIDISRVVPVPDWEVVARDYLGPAQAQALAGVPAAGRDAAFARAWSEYEARAKCLGLQLDEWDAARAARLRACRCIPLALPDGYVGCLALAAVAG